MKKFLALETIAFQDDSYANDVEALMGALVEDLHKGTANQYNIISHPSLKEIETLTAARMGVRIRLIPNREVAMSIPFYPNPFNPLISKDLRSIIYNDAHMKIHFHEQLKILDKALEHKGTVDTKNCKVTGFFTEYVSPIFLNFVTLDRLGLTAAEMTSIFIHELGHCFTAFEYSNRSNTTNQTLAALAKQSMGSARPKKEYIFRELKQINPKTTDAELEKIFSGENIILGRETMKFLDEVIQSQLINPKYDENSNEALSDTFVARWGYSKPLVTALDKIISGGLDKGPDTKQSARASNIRSFFGLVINLLVTIVLLVGVFSMLVIGAFFLAGVMLIFTAYAFGRILLLMFMHSDYNGHMTYDELKYRYKRVRDQLVELLKDTSGLTPAQVKETIDDIKTLDGFIEDRTRIRNVFTVIADFVSSDKRDIGNDIKLQRLLEDLSANSLYIKAASLNQAIS